MDEQRLSSVLSEFARTLVTDFPIQGILDHLVVRIVDVLPITAAGVTLISPDLNPHHIAASDDSALRFEKLQSELGEGPCIAAYDTGEAISIPDLALDKRFPTFATQAVLAGLAAVFTFPLRQGAEQLGALDLYRSTAGPMDSAAMVSAQTLADVASAYLLNARARAELLETTERAREISLHDSLTGLPNRALLIQLLDHAIMRCRRSGRTVGVLFADLDGFKAINDTFGHHVGDELLVAVAGRLSAIVRPGDAVARLSGDEFVIVCEDLANISQIEPVAQRVGDALCRPFHLSAAEVQISASVGIAFSGRGSFRPEEIIEEADTAMYQAKRRGRGRHTTIDLSERRAANDRASLSRAMRGALDRGELRTEYQPIVATVDGSITGVEALLRWTHPEFGSVAPQTAVVVAEQSGLIGEIGAWVLERACLDRHRWQRHRRYDRLEISVNVSAHQLMAPDFAPSVAAVLIDTATEPELVTLELTESVFLQDGPRALIVLAELADLGVKLALDDFGTGYSSLSYLNRFPIEVVKIDQVFVADLDRRSTSRLIVAAVVDLAHSLGITVVAEGVETAEQRGQLLALGCESCQGFHFARPMPAERIDLLLGGEGNLPIDLAVANL